MVLTRRPPLTPRRSREEGTWATALAARTEGLLTSQALSAQSKWTPAALRGLQPQHLPPRRLQPPSKLKPCLRLQGRRRIQPPLPLLRTVPEILTFFVCEHLSQRKGEGKASKAVQRRHTEILSDDSEFRSYLPSRVMDTSL